MAASSLRAKGICLMRALARCQQSGSVLAAGTQCGAGSGIAQKIVRPVICQKAFISTSDKNKVVGSLTPDKVKEPEKLENLEEKDENWISFGFNLYDRNEDEWAHHMTLLLCVTFLLVGGTFYFAYYPDVGDHSWAQREAYLELERREKAGLPLIDPDYISIDKITLPEDSELGDFEIII